MFSQIYENIVIKQYESGPFLLEEIGKENSPTHGKEAPRTAPDKKIPP